MVLSVALPGRAVSKENGNHNFAERSELCFEIKLLELTRMILDAAKFDGEVWGGFVSLVTSAAVVFIFIF